MCYLIIESELNLLIMKALQKATLQARSRTGKMIATNIRQGKIQVVEIEYDDNGKSIVTPLSDYMAGNKVVPYLNSL